MRVIKILRMLMKGLDARQNDALHLTEDEEKWYKVGFRDATSRFKAMLDLLEDED